MTFVLADRERLAAANLSFEAFPPLGFAVDVRTADMTEDVPDQSLAAPSFLTAARALADRHPESSAAIARLAQAEQAVGNSADAVTAALRVLEQEQSPLDHAAAVAAVQVLLSADERSVDARLLNRIPGDSDIKSVIAARLAVRRGSYDDALKSLESAASFEALSIKGWILLEKQRFTDAIAVLRQGLRTGPNVGLLVNLGYAYAATGAREKAIRATLQARALDPANRLVGMNLFSFYRAGGDIGAAIAELQRLRTETPDDVGLHIAEADLRLAVGDLDGAEKVLRRARTSQLWATAEAVERAELETNLAFLQFRQGRLDRIAALELVASQLERIGYASLDIASMLPALCTTIDDVRPWRISSRSSKHSIPRSNSKR